jgi:transcriptional regulator with XRE-family HTH domain
MLTEKQIVAAILEITKSLGYTQRCICRLMKTQESRFSDIKSGRKAPGMHFLLDFSRAVRMPLSTIFLIAEKQK